MDESMPRCPVPPALSAGARVIAVLRAEHASMYTPVIESLVTGGIKLIELTLSTQGAVDFLPGLRSAFGQAAEIGVGTVTTAEEAENVLDAGGQFLVTPTVNPPAVAAALRRGVPVFPGGLTPTELFAGWSAGATAVKVFPASAVGPDYIGQLRGPFPQMRLIPSGGVSIEDAPGWITAGALAVSLGGPLVRDAFTGGNRQQLTDRARRVTSLVNEAFDARAEAEKR